MSHNAKELLAELAKCARRRYSHPWEEYAELIGECQGICSASRFGFTVQYLDGERFIRCDGGLTSEHYRYFSPQLNELDQVELAKGVIDNRIKFSGLDEDIAWKLACEKYGPEEEWLPDRISELGFDLVVAELKLLMQNYRLEHLAELQHRLAAPRWDENSRSLWLGQVLIKKFTKPAPNQVIVLQAFEEERWPNRIFDPLKPGHIADVVKSLNRKHVTPNIIRFGRDGSGEGIRWYVV
jgi:hypothetical protein